MFDTSTHWLLIAIDVSVKSCLLAAVAFLLLKVLKVRNSGVSHRVWAGVLCGMLALPVLSRIVPAIPLPFRVDTVWLHSLRAERSIVSRELQPPAETSNLQPEFVAAQGQMHAVESGDSLSTDSPLWLNGESSPLPIPLKAGPSAASALNSSPANTPAITAMPPLSDAAPVLPSWAFVFRWLPLSAAIVWIFGTLVMLLRLLLGLLAANGIVRRASRAVVDVDLLKNVKESPEISVPVTVGLFCPCVLLPQGWRDWSAGKLEAVMTHERTHVDRRDFLFAVLAEVNRCFYWFHPLSWWLKKRLSDLAEEACDDAAIGLTGDPAGYARHLLEVAASLSRSEGRVCRPGLSMARKSNVEGRITTILDLTRPLSERLSWKAATIIAAAMLPVITVAAALRPTLPVDAVEVTGDEKRNSITQQGEAKDIGDSRIAVSVDLKGKVPSHSGSVAKVEQTPATRGTQAVVKNQEDLEISGTVTVARHGFENQLPAGLTVDVFRVSRTSDRRPRTSKLLKSVPVDSNGSFSATVVAAKLPTSKQWNIDWLTIQVQAPQHGFVAVPVHHRKEASSVRLQLPARQPVMGRILDLEGKPVAGAKLRIQEIIGYESASMDAWLKFSEGKPREPNPDEMLNVVSAFDVPETGVPKLKAVDFQFAIESLPEFETDANGRFSLAGIGHDQMLSVVVAGPRIAKTQFSVIARSLQDGRGKALSSVHLGGRLHYGAKFDFIAAPSSPVTGVVRDIETKVPLAGIAVEVITIAGSSMARWGWLSATTDTEGRYELRGLPTSPGNKRTANRIVVKPIGKPYLNTEFVVPSSSTLQPIEFNPELRRAILAEGRLLDVKTDQSVRGYVYYTPFIGNAANKDYPQYSDQSWGFITKGEGYQVDVNGRFHIPVIPGRGLLVTRVYPNVYRAGYGVEQIEEFRNTGASLSRVTSDLVSPASVNSLKVINVPTDSDVLSVDLFVDPGGSAEIQFVDASGHPLPELWVDGLQAIPNQTSYITDSKALVTGLNPGERRAIHIRDTRSRSEWKLSATTIVAAGVSAATVRVLPAVRVTGTLVDKQRQPLKNRVVSAIRTGPMRHDRVAEPVATGDDGRFELKLPADGLYHIMMKPPLDLPNKFTYLWGVPVVTHLKADADGTNLGVVTPDYDKTNEDKSFRKWGALPGKIDINRPQAAAEKPVLVTKVQQSIDVNDEQIGLKADAAPLHIHGQVVDASGNRLSSARVRLYRTRGRQFHTWNDRSRLVQEIEVNADGEFDQNIARERLPDEDGDAQWVSKDWLMLVVSAPGHAYATHSFPKYGETEPLDIVLKKDVTIRGRLIGLEGQPLSRIRVQAVDCSIADTKKLDAWMQAAVAIAASKSTIDTKAMSTAVSVSSPPRFPSKRYLKLPREAVPAIMTNNDGEFALRGFSEDHSVALRISGAGVVESDIDILGRLPSGANSSESDKRNRRYRGFYSREFEHIVPPGADVFGVVRDADSKQLLPGIRVGATQMVGSTYARYGYISTVTDAEGRYRLEGMPVVGRNSKKVNHLGVFPGPQPYILNTDLGIRRNTGTESVEFDLELKKAVLAKGRLHDRETGKPVKGRVYYSPFRGNPHIADYPRYADGITTFIGNGSPYPTDKNGEFVVPVIPGRGVLCAKADDGSYVTSLGASDISEFSQGTIRDGNTVTSDGISLNMFHSLKVVEVASETIEFDVDLPVTKGKSLTVRFVDREGNPLSRIRCLGLTSNPTWRSVEGSEATMTGVEPGLIRPFFVVHEEPLRKRIGRIGFKEGMTEQTIQLLPMAAISGRLLDQDGNPISDVGIVANYQTNPESSSSIQPTSNSDADGRFKIWLPVGTEFDLVGKLGKYFRVGKVNLTKPVRIDYGDLIVDRTAKSWSVAAAKRPPVTTDRDSEFR